MLYGFDLTLDFIVVLGMMVFALVGLIYCAAKQKKNPDMPVNFGPIGVNPQVMAVFLIIVVIGCAGFILSKKLGSGDTQKLITNEMFYSRARAVVLGQELAKKFPKSTVLVIVNDKDYEKNKFEANLVDGLKAGFNNQMVIDGIDAPDLPKSDTPEMQMPMEMMFKAEHFDALVEKYPKCNLIVSLMGLPSDFQDIALWMKEDAERPKVGLIDGDVEVLKDAIADGYISALVAYKPGVKFSEKPAPKDPNAAFSERYQLVTTENIDSIVKKE